MIEIGNIVTLENHKDYLLLEDVSLGERKFVYAVRVLEDETPKKKYIIFECVYAPDGEYLKDVNNKEEYDALIALFKDKISNKIISGEYEDMVQQGE